MQNDMNERLESVIRVYLKEREMGRAPSPEELIQANGEFEKELRDFFTEQETVPPLGDPLEETLHTRPKAEIAGPIGLELETQQLQSGNDASSKALSAVEDLDETIPPGESDKIGGSPDSHSSVLSKSTNRSFGNYDLLDEIARGGMGVVFKARQRALNRTVALKMILTGQFAGQAEVQRFRAEAEAAAKLDHSGIVPIFEIGEHAGHHFFSMGYIEGCSLAQSVAKGPLTSHKAAELVQKVCDAIEYAHQAGVIHRDLKPGNILLDSAGQPKVTDFGLAKQMETDSNLTGTGQILGTPAYMPPEQAAGRIDEVGPLSDVYSLGAVLYAVLTGRPPFQSASPMDTLMQVLDREPIPPRQLDPQIDRDLEIVCMKCLEKEADDRYDSARSLSDDLGRFLRDEPIQARPPSLRERTMRWARNNVVVVTTVMLLFATTILMLPFTNFGLSDQTRDSSDQQFGVLVSEMQRLIDEDPNNAAAHFELAKGYLSQGQLDQAITMFNRAIRLDDAKWMYHLQLGTALAKTGRFHQALTELDRSIEMESDSAEAFYQRALCRYELNQLEECLDNLSHSISLRPGFAAAYSLRAEVLSRLGRAEESEGDRDMAIRLGIQSFDDYRY